MVITSWAKELQHYLVSLLYVQKTVGLLFFCNMFFGSCQLLYSVHKTPLDSLFNFYNICKKRAAFILMTPKWATTLHSVRKYTLSQSSVRSFFGCRKWHFYDSMTKLLLQAKCNKLLFIYEREIRVKTSYYPSSPGTRKSDSTDHKSFPVADKTLC